MTRSILLIRLPCLPLSILWVGLALSSLSCLNQDNERAAPVEPPGKAVTATVGPPAIQNNPIAVPAVPSYPEDNVPSIANCVKLTIGVKNFTVSKDLTGGAVISNSCNAAVSILTAPVELRVRNRRDNLFTNEVLIEPLYARLYIFRKEIGLGEEAFIGDGGIEVSAWPSHALVGPRTKRDLAITGAAGLIPQLPPGEYRALLLTLVGPGLSKDAGIPFFDLAQDVKTYSSKQKNAGHLARRPGTVEISSSVTSFKVTRAGG